MMKDKTAEWGEGGRRSKGKREMGEDGRKCLGHTALALNWHRARIGTGAQALV